MGKIRNIKEADCIARLFKLANCYEELVDFLMAEKIISESDLVNLKLELNKPKLLHEILKKAEKEDKLILLAFDWIVLPIERLRLQLITERSNKEFTYKY